jgi:YD repeat-containing protein
LVRQTDALGRIDTHAYDAMGNMTTAADRRGAVTTVSYDGLNRPVTASVTVSWDAGLNRSITCTYDRARSPGAGPRSGIPTTPPTA